MLNLKFEKLVVAFVNLHGRKISIIRLWLWFWLVGLYTLVNFTARKPLRRAESLFKLSVINGHGEVQSKMNYDCFIKIELMYFDFIDNLWIYCVVSRVGQNASSLSDIIHSLTECSRPPPTPAPVHLLFNLVGNFKVTLQDIFYKRNACNSYHRIHQCMIPVTRPTIPLSRSSFFKQNDWSCRLSFFTPHDFQTCTSLGLVICK